MVNRCGLGVKVAVCVGKVVGVDVTVGEGVVVGDEIEVGEDVDVCAGFKVTDGEITVDVGLRMVSF